MARVGSATGSFTDGERIDTGETDMAAVVTLAQLLKRLDRAGKVLGAPSDEKIRTAGTRWAVEECFQTANTEVGLDHYQVCRYDARAD